MFSRRMLQGMLGVYWLIAGLWQLQAKRFTRDFITWCLAPQADFEPPWLSHSMGWMANLLEPHIALYNGFFAGIPILIGLALIFNVRVRTSLAISFLFAGFVWWFGEGLGQLFDGRSLLLTGAPGAALLFGMSGIVVWPVETVAGRMPVAAQRTARCMLSAVLILGGWLQLQSFYLQSKALSEIPSQFLMLFGQFVYNHSIWITIVLASVLFILGIGILLNRKIGFFLYLTMLLSLVLWLPIPGPLYGNFLFPSIGGLTFDPGEGLLIILLCLCSFSAKQVLWIDV
ncbi:MAG: hypothetical protein JWN30_1031 [Bacilli bacterium]|nr:hypothetical protein [Bacilli bacterium]